MMGDNDYISFTKMQATGNDFVVLDNRSASLSKDKIIALTPEICDRNFGVGSDGILALFPAERDDVDFTMFFRNPDGSDAGMCGNGARCMSLFAYSLGFKKNHRFNVHNKVYEAAILSPEKIRISFPMEATAKDMTVDGRKCHAIQTGTEHLVTAVDKETLKDEEKLREEGSMLRHNTLFQPKGTNVNFICGLNETNLKLQTFERGVENLTLACGTGAIASALIWHHIQNPNRSEDLKFTVETKGGSLSVYFSFNTHNQTYSNIKLEGPAHFVFKGEYML
ncbi:MAG TPA: diaminopimelate epimerase [Balneolaceae bacterium]|nr:diaminopimelate epimerase [Balneolaceae bacterium]